MKLSLLVLFAVCAVAAAMVPRDRRAVDFEGRKARSVSTDTVNPKEICSSRTPCAWSTYKPATKVVEMNFTNTYCMCGLGTMCQVTEDDMTTSTYVYRCRPHDEGESSDS